MERGLQMCKISRAADHPGHILTRDHIRLLRILQRRQAHTMDHHRPPLPTTVVEEVDLDNLRLLLLGKF